MDIQWQEFKDWLYTRLQQPLPGIKAQKRMMRPGENPNERFNIPTTAKKSGVLMLLYPDQHDCVTLVLIQRSQDGGVHSGQIALPGGKKEPSDVSLTATALREANEEVHLSAQEIEVIGELTHLYIPVSNFLVQPVLAIANHKPFLLPSDDEVANILEYSLWDIFCNSSMVKVNPNVKSTDLYVQTKGYLLPSGHIIWGATAMMLAELESLWVEFWHQFPHCMLQ